MLDEDINTKLVSWKVPESEFTRTEKVTLRRLLSHSAGLTVHGFPGYAVTEPVPTIVQVLDGVKPANTDPVRVDIVPGGTFRYSGGGTTVVQLALVDQLGKPFPQIMDETVLSKLAGLGFFVDPSGKTDAFGHGGADEGFKRRCAHSRRRAGAPF